jgi:hypothetical protein
MGSSNGGEGDCSRAHDGSQLAPTFGVVNDKLHRSADNEIRLRGGSVTRRRVMWHWFDTAWPPIVRWRAWVVVRVSLFADQDSS